MRADAAPAPADAFWPNLLKPRWRLRLNWWIGTALTVLLFLFWTVPVAAVQALSSLDNLVQLDAFAWLRHYADSLGQNGRATLSGFVSSMVLQFFLFITLYSGLFQWLARMRGATSESAVMRHTVGTMLLFQLLLVLLASNIASSLYDSLQTLLENPLSLPITLAQNLPGQATFFMHYLLSGILYVSLFDSLQLFPLLALLACPGIASLFTCKDRLPKSDAPMPRASASARRQRLVTVYAKLFSLLLQPVAELEEQVA